MSMIFRSRRQRIFSIVVCGIYLLLLTWLVLGKFTFHPDRFRGVNWIPFYYTEENSWHFREVVYNVLAFVPAGVYASAFLAKKPVWARILPVFGLSVLYETLQWVLVIGMTDVTDVLMNTLGGLIGLGLFRLLGKIFPRRRMAVINGVGLGVECAGLALLLFLTLMNL